MNHIKSPDITPGLLLFIKVLLLTLYTFSELRVHNQYQLQCGLRL